MRLRAVLASLLTIVLLSFCCAASACQLRCDLGNAAHPCHDDAQAASHHERSGTQQMGGVQHCAMTGPTQLGHAPSLVCQSNEPCRRQLCGDLSAQWTTQSETAARIIPIRPVGTMLVEVRQPALALQSLIVETPPQRTTSALSMQTISLRI